MSLNKVLLIGNLTRDPEMRTTPNGQQVATFGLATNRTWTSQSGEKQEKAEFHNIVVWGKLADIASKYVTKGRKVYIEGRLQTREWEGQDGNKRNRTEIVAENFIMLDRGSGGGGPFANKQGSGANNNNDGDQSFPQQEEEIQLENIPF